MATQARALTADTWSEGPDVARPSDGVQAAARRAPVPMGSTDRDAFTS
jgi:hypothetical protein